MTNLFPRLLDVFAVSEYERIRTESPVALASAVKTQHEMQIWPAVGSRVTAPDLDGLRNATLDAIGVAHGRWPEQPSAGQVVEVDRRIARALFDDGGLTVSEGSSREVWSFLALVLKPDVVRWRAGGSVAIERFVCRDLTRHTLARLWWRALLFTDGLEDPEAGWALWRKTEIGEADMDQLQTRRTTFGRNPTVFRAMIRLYPDVIAGAAQAGVSPREVWREAFIGWIGRLGAFTELKALTEDELVSELKWVLKRRVLGIPAPAAPASEIVITVPPTDLEGSSAAFHEPAEVRAPLQNPEVPVVVETPKTLEDLPLRDLTLRLAELVRVEDGAPERRLVTLFERFSRLKVASEHRGLLADACWLGRDLGFVDFEEDRELWIPGGRLPNSDDRWGSWTMASFRRYVASGDAPEDPDELASELFRGAPHRSVRDIVGWALRSTREA